MPTLQTNTVIITKWWIDILVQYACNTDLIFLLFNLFNMYTWKKVLQHPFFSLDKIVRRKCCISGRDLLKIRPEYFKLNHWHIKRHTLYSKIEI